jgi:hypothetical protein
VLFFFEDQEEIIPKTNLELCAGKKNHPSLGGKPIPGDKTREI